MYNDERRNPSNQVVGVGCTGTKSLPTSQIPRPTTLEGFRPPRLLAFYYMDDTVFCCHKSIEGQALKAIEHLCSKYTMKSLGEIEWFLGIRVIRDRSKRLLWLSQEAYIDKMATISMFN